MTAILYSIFAVVYVVERTPYNSIFLFYFLFFSNLANETARPTLCFG